jgi:hypothetical protein
VTHGARTVTYRKRPHTRHAQRTALIIKIKVKIKKRKYIF